MIGFLSYIPTFAYIPHVLHIFIVFYILIRYKFNFKLGNKNDLVIIFGIILFSSINLLFGASNITETKDYFPFVSLILISYVASLYFNRTDAKIILFLVALECIFAILETLYGVSTFFKDLPKYQVFSDRTLLYYNRPLGLSENSSVLAMKILVGIILLEYFLLKEKIFIIIKYLMFLGLLLTFNRTVIICVILFYSFYIFKNYTTIRLNGIELNTFLVFSVFVFVFLFFNMESFSSQIFNQLTRSTGSIELSGRPLIWNKFLEFININFLMGNNSVKYFISLPLDTRIFHAHNSYLQVLATHGFIIFMLYILLIVKNIRSNNYVYILPIIIFSFTQYGIFWGVSLLDIVFFMFLFNCSNFNLQSNESRV